MTTDRDAAIREALEALTTPGSISHEKSGVLHYGNVPVLWPEQVDMLIPVVRRLVEKSQGPQSQVWLRTEWWGNHGCPIGAHYGDDGEMQCGACATDFLRMDIQELRARVSNLRLAAAMNKAMPAPPQETP